jgi:hypothetical protein
MRRAASLACKVTALLVFGAAHVRAETFSLYLSAPVGCPQRAALIEQVQARTEQAQLVRESGNLHFDVAIRRDRHGIYWGTLVSRLRTGKSSTRKLDGTRCDEVSAALAVIMALTIDPGARRGPIPIKENDAGHPEDADSTQTTTNSSQPPDAVPTHAETAIATSVPASGTPVSSLGAPTSATAPPAIVTATAPSAQRADATEPTSSIPQAETYTSAKTAVPVVPQLDLLRTTPARNTLPQGQLAIVGARVSVIAPHQPNRYREEATRASQWTLGIQGDLSPMLAPELGLWRIGAHMSWRSKYGPLASLAGSYGPKVVRSDDKGTRAELSYLGAALELGWQLLRRDGFTLDGLAVTAIGRLRGAGLVGPRIDSGDTFTATWVGVGPGLEARQTLDWGGAAFQAVVPVGLVRPSFSLTTKSGSTEQFFHVSSFGLELRMRIFVRCW